MNPTNGDKYRNKETGQVFRAKQCIGIHEGTIKEVHFNDGTFDFANNLPAIAPSQWLLTSAIGEQTICAPSDFNRNFTMHFEEDDGK